MVTATDIEMGTSQAARHLGVSRSYIAVLVERGKLPARKTPIGALFLQSDLDRWAREREQRRVEKAGQPAGSRE